MPTKTPKELREEPKKPPSWKYEGYELRYATAGQIFPRDGWYLSKTKLVDVLDIIYLDEAFNLAEKEAYNRGIEEALKQIEVMPKSESPYVRNHTMPSHGGTTLTNAYHNGFSQSLSEVRDLLNQLRK